MTTQSLFLAFLLLSAGHAQLLQRNGVGSGGAPRNRAPPIGVPGGYLVPKPTVPVCMPTTNYETQYSTIRDIVTSFVQGPGGGVSTSVAYETRVQPTTVFESDVSTRVSTYTEVFTSTSYRDVTSTYVTTIGGVPVTRTISSTVLIPTQIVSTAYTTIRSSAFITRTSTDYDVTTVVQPYTVTRTDQTVLTNTIPVYGSDATRTNTVTFTSISTIQTQPPPTTIYQTRTIQSEILTTTVIQPPPTQVTLTHTSTEIDVDTRTTTIRDITTRTERVTSVYPSVLTVGSTRRETATSTYRVEQTSQIVNTQTQYSTQLVPTTIYEEDVITSTIIQPPVYLTSTEQRLVTETLAGGVNVVTKTQYTTQFVQSTTVVSVGGGQQTVTETKTVKDQCGPTGYNYNPPSVAFNF